MPGIQVVGSYVACSGPALVVALTPGPGSMRLRLAAALGERESGGERVSTVAIGLGRRDDAEPAAEALQWLADHGRRGILRTRVPLGEVLVDEARKLGTTVMLELAHPDAGRQVALTGPGAATVSSLLLHAQYLREVGLEVGGELGPLMPVVHDDDHDIKMLVKHAAAADLRDVHLSVGRLSRPRYDALAQVLSSAELRALLVAYGVDPLRFDEEPGLLARVRRLPPVPHASLYHRVRRLAEDAGLRVDSCGCPAQCHLDPETTRAFVPVASGDLFADAG